MENSDDNYGWLSVLGDRHNNQNESQVDRDAFVGDLNCYDGSNEGRSSDIHFERNTESASSGSGLGFLGVFLTDSNLGLDKTLLDEQEEKSGAMPDWPNYEAVEDELPDYGVECEEVLFSQSVVLDSPHRVSTMEDLFSISAQLGSTNACDNEQKSSVTTSVDIRNHAKNNAEGEVPSEIPILSYQINCKDQIVDIQGTLKHTAASAPTDCRSTTIFSAFSTVSADIAVCPVNNITVESSHVHPATLPVTVPVALPAPLPVISAPSAPQLSISHHSPAAIIQSKSKYVADLEMYNKTLSLLLSVKSASSRMLLASCLMWGRLLLRTVEHPYLITLGGCASESMLFLADRTQYISDRYLTVITADDPETRHIQRLLQAREAVWGWVHKRSCFLSSLPFHQRQLLRETRDLDRNIEIAMAASTTGSVNNKNGQKNTVNGSDCKDDNPSTDIIDNKNGNNKGNDNGQNGSQNEAQNDGYNDGLVDGHNYDYFQRLGGVSGLHNWLSGAACDGDEEAQYALSRWFTPPTFQESSSCYACDRPFSASLFRHHCRCCGQSHCTLHSSQRRSLLRLGLGLISPVRVCDKCAMGVDEEIRDDNLTWRRMRVDAYLADFNRENNENTEINIDKSGINYMAHQSTKKECKVVKDGKGGKIEEDVGRRDSLIPYNFNCVDRSVDKIIRVADYSLQVVKSTVSLNYPTKLALNTMDILKRYGLSGLAGVLLRKDFMEAVETLKRISGIDHMFSLSLHELTACIYYKLAIDRGLRGCDPDSEDREHATRDTESENKYDGKDEDGENNGDYNENKGKSNDENDSENKNENSSNNSNNTADNLPKYLSENIYESELDEAIRLAPLAVNVVYEEQPADMQRLALTQGWSTILISTISLPEQPAYALFATATTNTNTATTTATSANTKNIANTTSTVSDTNTNNANNNYNTSNSSTSSGQSGSEKKERRKEVVLVVRGTASVQDIVTDIRAAPQQFPYTLEEISRIISPSSYCENGCDYDENGEENDEGQWPWVGGRTVDRDGWLIINKDRDLDNLDDQGQSQDYGQGEGYGQGDGGGGSGGGSGGGEYGGYGGSRNESNEDNSSSYACGGMARAALWLLGEIGPALIQLDKEGFDIIFVGHSMGGAVAALLCHLMRLHLKLPIGRESGSVNVGGESGNGSVGSCSAGNRSGSGNGIRNSTKHPTQQSAQQSHPSSSQQSFQTSPKLSSKLPSKISPPDIIVRTSFRCVTYGCPSSMCYQLADKMNSYVTSVVLHDDIISRITPQSIRLLMRELLVFRQQVFRHLRQDWSDVISRAKDLWSPRNREMDKEIEKEKEMETEKEKEMEKEKDKERESTQSLFPSVSASVSVSGERPVSTSSGSSSGIGSGSNCGNEFTSLSSSHNNHTINQKNIIEGEGEGEGVVEGDSNEGSAEGHVVIQDEERGEWIPSLWLPGRILHIYAHTGRYKIASVSRSLPTLRKIEVQGNIFTDHVGQTIFDALLEVRAVRASSRLYTNNQNNNVTGKNQNKSHNTSKNKRESNDTNHLFESNKNENDVENDYQNENDTDHLTHCDSNSTNQNNSQNNNSNNNQNYNLTRNIDLIGPSWTPYDKSSVCQCCQCPFTWHSTFRGEAQEYRERYNCRNCGSLVCGPCSIQRRAIPRIGLIQPSRVCDKCFHKGDYANM